MRAGQAIHVRACAAWWCARVLLRKTRTCGLLGSVLSVTWRERQRTSSAELERSAAISLGMQLDSSPLVLVAEVSSLLALRPRPIVRDVCGCCVRREGEGEVRSVSRSAQCAVGRWSACAMASKRARWRNWSSHLSSVLLVRQVTFVGSRPFGAACCSRAWVKTVEPWPDILVRGLSLRATVIAPARVCCSVVAFDNCKPKDLTIAMPNPSSQAS